MERERNGGMTLWQKERDGEEENDWRGKGEKRTAVVEDLKWETNAKNRINRVIKQTPKWRSFGNKERKNKRAIIKGRNLGWMETSACPCHKDTRNFVEIICTNYYLIYFDSIWSVRCIRICHRKPNQNFWFFI